MEEQKKDRKTEGAESGHPQCKPVDMQDKAPKATQESPDQCVQFGPGMTSTKVPSDGQQTPGITTTKQPG